MAASGHWSEPRVLAATKNELFTPASEDGYVVADTQFAQDRWLDDREIPPETRSTLAPFNHVRVGSGYPDLVGVDHIDDTYLAVDRLGERPPLVAIEAKGDTGTGHEGVDIERGVVQAHDRLDGANVAYVTAPVDGITDPARTLARELNVGVLGVTEDGSLQVFEQPRVVGVHGADEASALRFQASAQGVAERSFGLNHPKNYLAFPLALCHEGDTRTLVSEHVVGAVDAARRGAVFLGLVDKQPRDELTALGNEVVRFALRTYDSLDAALQAFEDWKRSRARFVEAAPLWGELTRRVVFSYPATELLVTELQQMHDDGVDEPTLVELVEWLHVQHPTFTVELFLRGDETVRSRVLTDNGNLRRSELLSGDVYHSPTVFQLKAMLYHAGILSTRGSEPSNLDPETDSWALWEPLSRWR